MQLARRANGLTHSSCQPNAGADLNCRSNCLAHPDDVAYADADGGADAYFRHRAHAQPDRHASRRTALSRLPQRLDKPS